MKPTAEHRATKRRPVRLACQAVLERGFRLLADTALDVSGGGMFVRTNARVLTGEPVLVSFFEPTESRWYDAEATVSRVVHARRKGDRGRCVGLSFAWPDGADSERLASALERCMWGTVDSADVSVDDVGAAYESAGDGYGVMAITQ